MGRNKSLEWTMIDANMKSGYLQRGQFGSFLLYSFIRSTIGMIFFLGVVFMLLAMMAS